MTSQVCHVLERFHIPYLPGGTEGRGGGGGGGGGGREEEGGRHKKRGEKGEGMRGRTCTPSQHFCGVEVSIVYCMCSHIFCSRRCHR